MKAFVSKGKVFALLALPLVLALTPLEWLAQAPTLCLFRNLFGESCPGCGMTRAFFALLHGEGSLAFAYNPYVVIVFPILAACYLRALVAALIQARWLPPSLANRIPGFVSKIGR